MPRFNQFGAITVIGNLLKKKWSAIILKHFASGITLPSDICTQEPGLSIPVMNERLRTMHRYDLIVRTPARSQTQAREHGYRLTSRGQRILQLLALIEQFEQLEDIAIQTNAAGRLLILAQLAPGPQEIDSQSRASSGGA